MAITTEQLDLVAKVFHPLAEAMQGFDISILPQRLPGRAATLPVIPLQGACQFFVESWGQLRWGTSELVNQLAVFCCEIQHCHWWWQAQLDSGTGLALLGRHRTAGQQLQRIDQYLLITCLAKTLRQRLQQTRSLWTSLARQTDFLPSSARSAATLCKRRCRVAAVTK